MIRLKRTSTINGQCCLKATLALIMIGVTAMTSPAWSERSDLGFAQEQYTNGDYHTAIGAYKRALYYAPDTFTAEKAKLGLARAYFNAEQYTEAETLLNDLVEKGRSFKKEAQWTLA